jgi:cation diffusion facilitator family transporter
MAEHCCAAKSVELERLALRADQRRVLLIVLALNAAMFVAEFSAGLIAGSVSLMADSVDMLSDALVYGLSIYALDRSARWKAGAALIKGLSILALGIAILFQVATKAASGVPPQSTLMLLFAGLALASNLVCVRLLWRFRKQDVNMSSTFECSRNDAMANVGVLIAAIGVALTGSAWPDIAVGTVIALLFLRSSFGVTTDAWRSFRRVPAAS